MTFEHNGGPQTFTLEEYFNDATMYDVDDGDGSVVMAEVNEEQTVLTLTRVGAGDAVVEVTPSNSAGAGVVQSINVMVKTAPTLPKPPELKPGKTIPMAVKVTALDGDTAREWTDDPITDVNLATLNAAEKSFDLRDLIKDPERADADLEFMTETSNPEFVAVYADPADTGTGADSNNGNERAATTKATLDKMTSDAHKIWIRGRKAGMATVTITASSDSGESETWTISVTVATSNIAPDVGAGDDGTTAVVFPGTGVADTDPYRKFVGLNDANRLKLNPTKMWKEKLDLGSLFYDPDVEINKRTTGDSWTFKAMSNNEKAVTVRLESTNNSAKPDEYYVILTPVAQAMPSSTLWLPTLRHVSPRSEADGRYRCDAGLRREGQRRAAALQR